MMGFELSAVAFALLGAALLVASGWLLRATALARARAESVRLTQQLNDARAAETQQKATADRARREADASWQTRLDTLTAEETRLKRELDLAREGLATAQQQAEAALTSEAVAAKEVLQSELAEAQRALRIMTRERDAARSQLASLERLVEGVRARSRELSAEVARLSKAR